MDCYRDFQKYLKRNSIANKYTSFKVFLIVLRETDISELLKVLRQRTNKK